MRKIFVYLLTIIIAILIVTGVSFVQSLAICYIAYLMKIRIHFKLVMFIVLVFNLFLEGDRKMNNGLYFTTDGKDYQEFQGLQEVTLETDMVDESEVKEIVTKGIMNGATFELSLDFDARRFIPRGQRNREILRRDGYLSPENADFMRGFDE